MHDLQVFMYPSLLSLNFTNNDFSILFECCGPYLRPQILQTSGLAIRCISGRSQNTAVMQRISELKEEKRDAVEKEDFKLATTLKEEFDKLEKRMKSHNAADFREKASELKKKKWNAVENENYNLAATLKEWTI